MAPCKYYKVVGRGEIPPPIWKVDERGEMPPQNIKMIMSGRKIHPPEYVIEFYGRGKLPRQK